MPLVTTQLSYNENNEEVVTAPPLGNIIAAALHFQMEASQFPGSGWTWYERMNVGLTVLTNTSNSSTSALRQSKNPCMACLDAASGQRLEMGKEHSSIMITNVPSYYPATITTIM